MIASSDRSADDERAERPRDRELALERVAIRVFCADICVFLVLLATLALSSSLTLLTEATRAGALTMLQLVSVGALRALHRRRFATWHYGVGKLESLCNLLGCSALVVGGLWIGEKIVAVFVGDIARIVPTDLAIAAVAATLATTVHGLALLAMKSVMTDTTSAIFIGQYRARQAKWWASLSASVAITLAALAYDPAIRASLDAIGATIGAIVMIAIGVTLGSRCVAALADVRLPDALRARIAQVLDQHRSAIPQGLFVRTRWSGRFAQVEVALLPGPHDDLPSLQLRAIELEKALAAEFGETLDVSVVFPAGNDSGSRLAVVS